MTLTNSASQTINLSITLLNLFYAREYILTHTTQGCQRPLHTYLMVNRVMGENSMKQRSAAQEAPRTEGATGRMGRRHTWMPATSTAPFSSRAQDPYLKGEVDF